jgi:hypothetical protein
VRNLLEDYIGREVRIWSEYGDHEYSDEGTLEAFDGVFVRLKKGSGEILVFPIYKVRLIKPGLHG